MNTQLAQKYQRILLAERERLIQNGFESLKQDLTVSSDDLPDEADHASSVIQQSLSFELRNRERMMISKINTALHKIQEGTFGTCDACEEPIEKKRLEARPFSVFCIACQEQNEHREKLFA